MKSFPTEKEALMAWSLLDLDEGEVVLVGKKKFKVVCEDGMNGCLEEV